MQINSIGKALGAGETWTHTLRDGYTRIVVANGTMAGDIKFAVSGGSVTKTAFTTLGLTAISGFTVAEATGVVTLTSTGADSYVISVEELTEQHLLPAGGF